MIQLHAKHGQHKKGEIAYHQLIRAINLRWRYCVSAYHSFPVTTARFLRYDSEPGDYCIQLISDDTERSNTKPSTAKNVTSNKAVCYIDVDGENDFTDPHKTLCVKILVKTFFSCYYIVGHHSHCQADVPHSLHDIEKPTFANSYAIKPYNGVFRIYESSEATKTDECLACRFPSFKEYIDDVRIMDNIISSEAL